MMKFASATSVFLATVVTPRILSFAMTRSAMAVSLLTAAASRTVNALGLTHRVMIVIPIKIVMHWTKASVSMDNALQPSASTITTVPMMKFALATSVFLAIAVTPRILSYAMTRSAMAVNH